MADVSISRHKTGYLGKRCTTYLQEIAYLNENDYLVQSYAELLRNALLFGIKQLAFLRFHSVKTFYHKIFG
jgi:hypothetical protein